MELSAIGSLIGALGVGSLATQLVLSGRSRREVRSAVLAQLAITENARWSGPGAPKFNEFRSELRALETAALIARVPQKAVQHYVVLAHAGRIRSQQLLDQHGGPEDDETGEDTSWLYPELGNLVTESAWILTKLAWSPWLGRTTLWFRLHALRKRIVELDSVEREAVLAGERIHGNLRLSDKPNALKA